MADWPAGLPVPQVTGCSYSPYDENVLRSQFMGGIKVRRTASAAPEIVTFKLFLTQAQTQILDTFARITCADVLPFNWIEFRDPAYGPATYKFRRRPRYAPENVGLYWTADIELDLLTPFTGTFDLGPLLNHDNEIITT